MKIPDIRLLAFDLDDTLLNSHKLITERSAALLRECHDRGMKVAYITARSPRKIDLFLQDLPCDALASFNGAQIHVGDRLVAEHRIPNAEGAAVVRAVRARFPDATVSLYQYPDKYFCGPDARIDNIRSFALDLDNTPTGDFERIVVWRARGFADELAPLIGPSLYSFVSPNCDAVILHHAALKENALRLIARELGIPLHAAAAFGDAASDIGMLRTAGVGVAVANAIQEAKDAADYLTASNDEDGPALFIEKYLL